MSLTLRRRELHTRAPALRLGSGREGEKIGRMEEAVMEMYSTFLHANLLPVLEEFLVATKNTHCAKTE